MESLIAEYRITTPMFLGGGNIQEAEGLRPPSIKGALRFWWRALNWGRFFKEQDFHIMRALSRLHKEECRLFGATAEEDVEGRQIGGQGIFLLSVYPRHINSVSKEELDKIFNLRENCWHTYLLGLGLCAYSEELERFKFQRGALLGDRFSITLRFHNRRTQDGDKEQLEKALLALGMLGGLGNRNRRGIGSISISKLQGGNLTAPINEEAWRKLLPKLINGDLPNDEPPLSAFCANSRIFFSPKIASKNTQNAGWYALEEVAQSFQLHRACGRNGKVNGIDVQRKYSTDHDLAYKIATWSKGNPLPDHPPLRSVFGLPSGYRLSSKKLNGKPVIFKNVQFNASGDSRTRRASPLLMHVHEFPDSSDYHIAQTFLPAWFLPPSDQIEIQRRKKWKKKEIVGQVVPPSNWNPINDYLKQFEKSEVSLTTKAREQ